MVRTFTVIIEQDEDGMYVGRVPELKGCLSQGETIDELIINIKEAIELCLEVIQEQNTSAFTEPSKFVGVQQVEVA